MQPLSGSPRAALRSEFCPTPTKSLRLPFRRGGFSTLCVALDYAARGQTGLNFYDAKGALIAVLPYADLRLKALRFARCLIGGGISRGERLIILADTWPGFCVGFFGAQYAGVIPVPVSLPVGLGAKDSYISQLSRQITAAGATAILAPEELESFASEAASRTAVRLVGSIKVFEALPETSDELHPLGPLERCYIQFTSGSTARPRGVDIRQAPLMANIENSIARQELTDDDSGVSWLPLYHDMGLVGFVLAPICAQRSVDLMAPRDFARRPMQWLNMISRRRATITYSPGFGYDLVTRRAQAAFPPNLDLSSLTLAGIGAEMIRPAILRQFATTFARCGFDGRAFMPSYGMAEVCVGFSFSRRFSGFRIEDFGDRELVSCGKPIEHHRMEIRNEYDELLPDRRVGRIFLKGPSVMPGYFDDDEETTRVISNGWFDTGDLGYATDGELVITGRAKDLIIVNGRNIWPQDIEWAVEALPRLRPGDACAFSVEGTQSDEVVVLIQHVPANRAEIEALVGRAHQIVRETVGIDCRIILISRRVKLPLTSSGKLSRAKAKDQFLNGLLPIEMVSPALGPRDPLRTDFKIDPKVS